MVRPRLSEWCHPPSTSSSCHLFKRHNDDDYNSYTMDVSLCVCQPEVRVWDNDKSNNDPILPQLPLPVLWRSRSGRDWWRTGRLAGQPHHTNDTRCTSSSVKPRNQANWSRPLATLKQTTRKTSQTRPAGWSTTLAWRTRQCFWIVLAVAPGGGLLVQALITIADTVSRMEYGAPYLTSEVRSSLPDNNTQVAPLKFYRLIVSLWLIQLPYDALKSFSLKQGHRGFQT